MKGIYIGLGSNLGDRLAHLQNARERLISAGVSFIQASPIYETAHVYRHPDDRDQPSHLNAVAQIQTDLSPPLLLRLLHEVEAVFGRVRRMAPSDVPRYAPRPLDLDLLFYHDQIIDRDDLVVPHPRLHQRRFVLRPMLDIAPDEIHPILNASITELLERCTDDSAVRAFSDIF